MKDPTTRSGLADQSLMWEPELHQDPADEGIDAADMDIVAATYRSIVDQNAFEEMVASWSAKLDPQPTHAERRSEISRQLLGQLMSARQMIERLDIPAENDPLKRAISDVPGPAVVLAGDGRVATVNIEGERAFGTSQGGFLDPEIIDPCSRTDFAALRRAASERGNGAQAILTIMPPEGSPGYSEPFLAEAYLVNVSGQNDAWIALRSLEIAWSAAASLRLQQAFGLSQAETEVARQFFGLRNIDLVAEARGASRLTVRTQVKAIMAKTGSPTNIDLMRLLAMIASRALLGQRGVAPVWHDPLNREEQLQMPDGRVVAWTWMGAVDGIPVVMLRGFPMTFLLPGESDARLREAGIKLFALSGPGYGNSNADSSLGVLGDHLTALRAFMDHAIDGPCLGVGLSQGLMPLLAESRANPRRFHSLFAVGYTGVLDRSGLQRLPLIQRTMMRLAATSPWVVELMAKTGHRQMREHGVDWYLERAYRTRPLDMQTYREPEAAALIRNACEHLLKQGHATFVRELQLALEPIDHVIEELEIPLLFLAPTEDGMFDEGSYRLLERRNPRISLELVPGAGELILYQRTGLILDRIITGARMASG